MKFSENWLREWVDPELGIQTLAERLTMAGLEVDGIESLAARFSGVIVGEILEVKPHPEADRLQLCRVATGRDEETVQIVCGAPNARVGLKAPLAVIGAELPDNFKIRKAKLRGVESFGMLCAADELGLEAEGEGLWELPVEAPVGAQLAEWLALNDHCIEIDLTPNRADCLSIKGVAREVGVLTGQPVQGPAIPEVSSEIEETLPVRVSHPAGCPRYLGRVIRDIDLDRPTPAWMQEKLRRSGLRSIDPVVDATNYVLLELGQPLHAFDLEQIQDEIRVRLAEAGERLILLDGREVELSPDTLIIADAGKPLAIAGVMGGEHSGVNQHTRHLFLECAYFSPEQLAGEARRYGLHTEASHRYERGVDPELAFQAMERVTALLIGMVGGTPGPVVASGDDARLPSQPEIPLRKSRLELVSGLSFGQEEVETILQGLGCTPESDTQPDTWRVKTPSWRFDLSIEEDLIEELTRIKGYPSIPEQPLRADLHIRPHSESARDVSALESLLHNRGYFEAITYSFIDAKQCELFGFGGDPVTLENPIASDMSVMRPSLLPGLLGAIKRNQDRQQSRLRFFEIGQRFVRNEKGDIAQIDTLAGAVTGDLYPEQWQLKPQGVSFYDVKKDVETLLGAVDAQKLTWKHAKLACLHPGRSAELRLDDVVLGRLGELHPQLLKTLELDGPVVVFELDLEALKHQELPVYQAPHRFPAVRRDIALVLDRDVSAQAILHTLSNSGANLLKHSRIFDIYTGQGIDSNKKSVALSLTFRDSSRTLEDQEVTDEVEQIIHQLQVEFDAILRQ